MKKGSKVTVVVKSPVAKTEESRVIEKVTQDHIYVEGLEVPFDKKTGIKTESFGGMKVYIKEIAKL